MANGLNVLNWDKAIDGKEKLVRGYVHLGLKPVHFSAGIPGANSFSREEVVNHGLVHWQVVAPSALDTRHIRSKAATVSRLLPTTRC